MLGNSVLIACGQSARDSEEETDPKLQGLISEPHFLKLLPVT